MTRRKKVPPKAVAATLAAARAARAFAGSDQSTRAVALEAYEQVKRSRLDAVPEDDDGWGEAGGFEY